MSVTVTRRRLAVLVGFAALEISVVVYFRNQFLWVALVTYVTLDRYLAGCALTGCPRVPFP